MTKIVKIEEEEIHIFWKTWWIFTKFLGDSTFWNIFLELRRGFFLEWNFNISFCRIIDLSFYLNKNELRKNLCKSLGKKLWHLTYAFWYMLTYVITYWWFYGNCRTLEGKAGKEITESWKLEFLERFSVNYFTLSDTKYKSHSCYGEGV